LGRGGFRATNMIVDLKMKNMSKYGTFYVKKGGRLFLVEPISEHANRNADWNNGIKEADLPFGGAVHPSDSIITDDKFKNIITLGPGISPLGYIDQICEDE
jgi:hypothetical protein